LKQQFFGYNTAIPFPFPRSRSFALPRDAPPPSERHIASTLPTDSPPPPSPIAF
jgi:hypothetical protein